MELYRWIKMVLMPRRLAISQACWPPAPPKLARLQDDLSGCGTGTNDGTYVCLDAAYPLASVSARIGRHIVSLATLMNLSKELLAFQRKKKTGRFFFHPYTTSSRDNFLSCSSLISAVSCSKARFDASISRGSFSDFPNIFGK